MATWDSGKYRVMVYSLNRYSFIEVPKADVVNGFCTVVFNIKNDRVIKVNKEGYFILKYLDDEGSVGDQKLEELSSKINISMPKIRRFLDFMVRENIVFCEE